MRDPPTLKGYVIQRREDESLFEYSGRVPGDSILWHCEGGGWIFRSYAEAVRAQKKLGGFVRAVWLRPYTPRKRR